MKKKSYAKLNLTLVRNLKKKIEQLSESEGRFRLVFENAEDGILAADAVTRKFVLANPKICKLTGYSKKELLQRGIDDLHKKKDLPRVLGQFRRQVRKEISIAYNIPVLRKDRTIVYCDINSSSLRLKDKEIIVGFFRDVTERRKAEEALRQSESKYRTLLENLPQKIFFKNRSSVYISCNNNYARDLKIKVNEIAGKTDYDFYPKSLAAKYRADDRRVMKSGKARDMEERYVQNGKEKLVHTVKTPVKDKIGKVIGVLGIFWDITKRKKTGES